MFGLSDGLTTAGNQDLNLVERLYLRNYLASREDELNEPVGTGSQAVTFVIAPGERADQIATKLIKAGLTNDPTLFRNYVRFHGYDSQLEAGTFHIDPNMTLPELALSLTRALPDEIELRFIEGWRLEEMGNYLEQIQPANIDPEEFLAIVRRQQTFDLSGYDFLNSLPPEFSLEGFLFPDTYRIELDTDAATLVTLMLDNYGQRISPSLRQAFGTHGLTVYEAVTLASIVQREAVVAEERPLMVGVFLNRMEQDILLQADPTVQYALGFQPDKGSWWKAPLYESDLQIDSPYNTYVYSGLPPGPIASPGLASLTAVAQPAETDFLFFVVDCTSEVPGSHVFSTTFEEHLANVQRCR